jgi:hypothetical protein
MSNSITNYKVLLDKVSKVTSQHGLDLSSGEDLSIGIMNLISIEEHLFYTFNKTKDVKTLDLLNDIRKMRTELMREIVKEPKGEVWCISKHLLAASMRVMEVGTKELKKGSKEKASNLFEKSYQLYSLFWGLNLGVVNLPPGHSERPKGTKESHSLQFVNDDNPPKEKGSESVFSKLGNIINKALDCCRE